MKSQSSGATTGISRRDFMAGLAAMGASIPISGLAKSSSSDKFPICIFSRHLQWCDYDATGQVAAEIGFDGVDLSVRPGGHVVPERVVDDLPKAVTAIRKAGLEVHMITTAITDPGDRYTEPILATASQLGIKYYRMGYLQYDASLGIARSLESFKSRIAGLAELNKKYSIHGAYQNHAGTRVGAPVWDLWILIKDLDPLWIGCQYDIRHATVEGGSCWPLGLEVVQPFIKTLVIKDFKWAEIEGRWRIVNVPVGEGMVNFDQFFMLLKKFKIQGPISVHVEYEISPDENQMGFEERKKVTVPALQKDLQAIRAMKKQARLGQ